MDLTKLFTDKVQSMKPYQVQPSGGMIKLDAMEIPFKLPEDMQKALGTILEHRSIHRYPNPESPSLSAKIKKAFQIPTELEILLGNGSDELILIILMALARPNSKVMALDPSFVMYKETAELLHYQFIGVSLNNDFTVDQRTFLETLNQEKPAVTFIASPNNPTGNTLDQNFLEKIIQQSDGFVIIDEAYGAFAKTSAIDLVDKYDNVLMVRTLSKIGMAGIRLGYMVGKKNWITEFNKARMPYNINVFTNAAATFMLDQLAYLQKNIEIIKKEKQNLYDWFLSQKIEAYATETNFLLIRIANAPAVFEQLRDHHQILIKNLSGVHPTLQNILRITIGAPHENEKLKTALLEILNDE